MLLEQRGCSFLRNILANSSGISLLEMIFAIAVVGLLLGFGLTSWFAMKSSQQINAAGTIVRNGSTCLENYVIHSGKIPPVSYFTAHCAASDPWHNQLIYENTGDDTAIAAVLTRTFKDINGIHPDAAWIVASFGPNGSRDLTTSAGQWDCSSGDDICLVVSKNGLLYEINK